MKETSLLVPKKDKKTHIQASKKQCILASKVVLFGSKRDFTFRLQKRLKKHIFKSPKNSRSRPPKKHF